MTLHPAAKKFLSAVFLIVLCASVYGLYAWLLQVQGNFHTVIAGELYRSSQPTPQQLADYQKQYGIKTVINLRGKNTGSPWYDKEVQESQALGLNHIDFRMSARRELKLDRAKELVSILQNAEKPILVHCNSGADRTGLASALFLAAIDKRSEEDAEAQISLLFGHVPIPLLSSSFAMDQSFEELEFWLGFDGS